MTRDMFSFMASRCGDVGSAANQKISLFPVLTEVLVPDFVVLGKAGYRNVVYQVDDPWRSRGPVCIGRTLQARDQQVGSHGGDGLRDR